MLRQRSGPPVKHIEIRSVAGARVKKSTAPSQATPVAQIATAVDEIDVETLIKQFEHQRAIYASTLDPAEQAIFADHSNSIKRRISYPREYKLSAVAYALTGKILDKKSGEMKPITKWKAAQQLGITYPMIKDWIGARVEIEALKKGCRKNRTHMAKFPALEQRLFEQFNEIRKEGAKITKQWFIISAKHIFKDTYPNKVSHNALGRMTCEGFSGSDTWFRGFRGRFGVALRRPTKISQKASWYMSFLIID